MHKILFIDDERRQSQPLVKYLKLVCGWNVKFVTSPEAALDALRDEGAAFDLILLDVMMPPGSVFSPQETSGGMDTGLLLLERIAQFVKSEPKVVVYSARRDLDFLKEDPSVAGCIQKPATASEVAAVIQEVLG